MVYDAWKPSTWRIATGAFFFQTTFFSLGPVILRQFLTPEAVKDLLEVFWWTPFLGSGLGLLGLLLTRVRAASTIARLIYLPSQHRLRVSVHTLLGGETWAEVPLHSLFVQPLDPVATPVQQQYYIVKVAVQPGKYKTMELDRSAAHWGSEDVQRHLFGAVIAKPQGVDEKAK